MTDDTNALNARRVLTTAADAGHRWSWTGAMPVFALAGLWAHSTQGQTGLESGDLSRLWAPILVFSGLHWRLSPFLHAGHHGRGLSLPISAIAHWRAARRSYGIRLLPGLLSLALLGCLPAGPGILRELAPLMLSSLACEGLCIGIAARYGRRFPADSPEFQLQSRLSGGWTTREATIHLYAPVASVVVGLVLAMPLSFFAEQQGELAAWSTPLGLGLWLLIAMAAGVAWRTGAKLYCSGYHEACARIVEATRTVAGPEAALSQPAWLFRVLPRPEQAAERLLLTFLWRRAPVSGLRAIVLLAVTVGAAMSTVPIGWAAAACGLWLGPNLLALAARRELVAGWASLPIARPLRSGGGYIVHTFNFGFASLPLLAHLLAERLS